MGDMEDDDDDDEGGGDKDDDDDDGLILVLLVLTNFWLSEVLADWEIMLVLLFTLFSVSLSSLDKLGEFEWSRDWE